MRGNKRLAETDLSQDLSHAMSVSAKRFSRQKRWLAIRISDLHRNNGNVNKHSSLELIPTAFFAINLSRSSLFTIIPQRCHGGGLNLWRLGVTYTFIHDGHLSRNCLCGFRHFQFLLFLFYFRVELNKFFCAAFTSVRTFHEWTFRLTIQLFFFIFLASRGSYHKSAWEFLSPHGARIIRR